MTTSNRIVIIPKTDVKNSKSIAKPVITFFILSLSLSASDDNFDVLTSRKWWNNLLANEWETSFFNKNKLLFCFLCTNAIFSFCFQFSRLFFTSSLCSVPFEASFYRFFPSLYSCFCSIEHCVYYFYLIILTQSDSKQENYFLNTIGSRNAKNTFYILFVCCRIFYSVLLLNMCAQQSVSPLRVSLIFCSLLTLYSSRFSIARWMLG